MMYMMTVKKYKLNTQTNDFEHVTDYKVSDDQAFVEMSMDPLTEIPNGIAVDAGYQADGKDVQNAPFLYEAGKMVGDTFYLEFVWQSENGNLFEQPQN